VTGKDLVPSGTSLTEQEARSLTEEVKRDLAALWEKCVRLYEGQAHLALGYSSWAAYAQAEFGMKKAAAHRALNAGLVLRVLAEEFPNGNRPNEAQARELARLKDGESVLAAWGDAQAEAELLNKPVTAQIVGHAVERRVGQPTEPYRIIFLFTSADDRDEFVRRYGLARGLREQNTWTQWWDGTSRKPTGHREGTVVDD
jgi:hypothetical protein